MTANARLLELLERGELDWDNEKHREAYLKAWVCGEFPVVPRQPGPEPEPGVPGG